MYKSYYFENLTYYSDYSLKGLWYLQMMYLQTEKYVFMGYNKNTLSKFTDQSFCHYMNHGIISLDDVMGASQETIMKSIIDKVHGFPITKIRFVSNETFKMRSHLHIF